MSADTRFASRKWRLALIALFLATLSRALSWIDGPSFVSLVEWIVGLYMAGNVGRAAVDKISIGDKAP